MPGRQTVEYGGLELRISPGFWLRRWLRFPFYFESTNPSFRIEIKCLAPPARGEEWKEGEQLVFQVVFADKSFTDIKFAVPRIEVGQRTNLLIPSVYCSYPGQTIIRFPLRTPNQPDRWHSLYSYHVRTEEQLWLWAVGPLIGLFLGTGAALFGVLIQRWLS